MDVMDVDYSLGQWDFAAKYKDYNPKATGKDCEDAYNNYRDFYVKYHSDHPAATTDCYEKFLETLGKQATHVYWEDI